MSNENTETAIVKLTADDYPIMQPERFEGILKAVKENVPETESLSIFDLITVTSPAGTAVGLQVARPEGTVSMLELDGVILAIKPGRSYWKTPYGQSGGNTPPECQSSDGIWGVGEPGGDCDACDLGQFKGECRPSTLLLVAVKDELLPWIIRVSPGSLGSVGNYLRRVLTIRGLMHWAVVTQFYVQTAKSGGGVSYGQIHCKMLGRLSEEDAVKCKELKQQSLTLFTTNTPGPTENHQVQVPVPDGSAQVEPPF